MPSRMGSLGGIILTSSARNESHFSKLREFSAATISQSTIRIASSSVFDISCPPYDQFCWHCFSRKERPIKPTSAIHFAAEWLQLSATGSGGYWIFLCRLIWIIWRWSSGFSAYLSIGGSYRVAIYCIRRESSFKFRNGSLAVKDLWNQPGSVSGWN